MTELEDMWAALLSEKPPQIRKAWGELKDEEASAVLTHLRRMAEEDGWAEVQQQAARAALQVIQDNAEAGGF
jgi:hypothetical protein